MPTTFYHASDNPKQYGKNYDSIFRKKQKTKPKAKSRNSRGKVANTTITCGENGKAEVKEGSQVVGLQG